MPVPLGKNRGITGVADERWLVHATGEIIGVSRTQRIQNSKANILSDCGVGKAGEGKVPDTVRLSPTLSVTGAPELVSNPRGLQPAPPDVVSYRARRLARRPGSCLKDRMELFARSW